MLTKIRNLYKNSRISRNTAPKLLSLLFAAILWLYVMNQVNPEIVRDIQNVPVKLMGIEEMKSNSLEIMGEVDYFVDVKIKGRRKEAFSITSDNIELVADLRGYDKGMNNVPLRKSINAENITILELSKPDIKVFLDKIVEIPKEVKVRISGEVANGYVSEDLLLQPESVTVQGPESIVNTVNYLSGELNIGDGTSAITKDIPIIAINNDGETVTGVTLKSDYIRAIYKIKKRKSVMIAENIKGNVASGYKLISTFVTPSSVVIDGDKSVINTITFMKVNEVNVDGLKDNFKVKAQLVPLDGVSLPFFNDNVMVEGKIEEIISKEFTIAVQDIPTINLNTEYETNISQLTDSVIVRVNDASSILDNVKKDDIELFVDASQLKLGVNNVDLKINASGNYESVQIIPNRIEIEIIDKTKTETVDPTTTPEDQESQPSPNVDTSSSGDNNTVESNGDTESSQKENINDNPIPASD